MRAVLAQVHHTGRVAESARIDLAAADAVAALDALLKRVPPIDILVNNAGWLRTRPFPEISREEWQRHLDINLTGMFLVTRAVLPGMVARGAGRIITISSEWGITGAPAATHYVAAKAGLIGFTRALALEVADRGILVNAIAWASSTPRSWRWTRRTPVSLWAQ